VESALVNLGFSVFCYATLVSEGSAWVSVLTHGIEACAAFVPICSPQYGDLDLSPWTHNELVQATRRKRACASPAILPIWHHGAYPPADTAPLLAPGGVPLSRVPAGDVPAVDCEFEEVMTALLASLKAAGVEPRDAPAV
jgi:hypothetical protein